MLPDIHTLAGAYVLDAIEPEERAAFEAHLAECESCREEVDALQMAAAALALEATSVPPEHLRASVLAAAQWTPQLLPVVDRPGPSSRRTWVPRLLAVAAAVVLLAAGGVTLRALVDDGPEPITAAAVFEAADARTAAVPLRGGEVRVALSERLDRIAVDGADMPAPPEAHAYQLWLVADGQATSLSVMEGDETTAVERIPEEGVLAVTIEPSGGSDQPTTEPILTLDPADL